MSFFYIISFLLPFSVSLALIPAIRKLALTIGFVDRPSTRKIHGAPIPLGGGLAVFIGFVFILITSSMMITFADARPAIGIVAGAVLIVLIGIYDDAFEMGVGPKMLGQIVAAVIFLAFVDKLPPLVSFPAFLVFGTVWIVGVQNSLNFLDNMDGLCAGVAMTAAIGLGVLFVLKEMPIFAIMSFALAGGALGFLRYNLPPASIFLGDTGSLLFGYVLACLAVVHLNSSKSLADALSPLLIMAYPVFDLIFVTVSRLNEGRKVYIGGKDHSSHKISFMGLNRGITVSLIHGINFLLIAMGVMLFFISESPYQTLVITLLALALAFAGTHLYKNFLFLNRRILALILDAVSVGVSILLYVLMRQSAFLMGPLPLPAAAGLLIPSAWIAIFWILVFAAGGMYDIPPELKFRYQVLNLTRLVVLSGMVFVLATYRFGGGFQISPLSVALFALVLIAVNSTIRGIFHKILADRIKSGKRKLEALIVMPGPLGPERLDSAKSSVPFYKIVGYVGDCIPNGAQYLGPISALGGILRDNRIASVVLDIPASSKDNLRPIFNAAFFMDTRFLVPAKAAGVLRGLKRFATISNDVILVTINTRKIFSRMLKRLLDISTAAASLILLSPYYATRAGLVRLGKIQPPSTYSIIGIGEHGKTIRCETDKMGNPKFRSMWGLLAVIKGDLSLIGTTITTTEELDKANAQTAGLWRKFLAKPGLFGPGYQGKNAGERFDLDLEYTEKSSLFYDLYAIIRQLSGL